MSLKTVAALALATIIAAVANAYANYRVYETGPSLTSPEATVSRTPGGPNERFN